MLPKFSLMMIDSSDDEKSGSSDGEDGHSLGMDNHMDLQDIDHTNDITDDDPQLIEKQQIVKSKLFSPTFPADSISRRSSVNLTSGLWDDSLNLNNNHIIPRIKNNTSSTPTYSN